MAPSLEILSEIEFENCAVSVRSSQDTIIDAAREQDRISIGISGIEERFTFDRPDAEILGVPRARQEYFARLQSDSRLHPVIQTITRSSTPMFLGLDRRFLVQDRSAPERGLDEAIYEPRRTASAVRHLRGDLGASLSDVQLLVRDTMAEVRAEQEEIDGDLRRKIISDAFAYVPASSADRFQMPSAEVIASFKKKKASIEQAVGNLGVAPAEVEGRLTEYFERLEKLIKALERGPGYSKKGRPPSSELLMEWIVNKPQVDRINSLFRMIEEHVVTRAGVSAPIDNFLTLVNRFLSQTRKKLVLTPQDYLAVQFDTGNPRPLSALSSGERQIVVMLAHLSLNQRSGTDGIFIVDEPELSLHIAWQEMFVDAIHQASPKTQLILATHSPAIILGRDASCVMVNGVA